MLCPGPLTRSLSSVAGRPRASRARRSHGCREPMALCTRFLGGPWNSWTCSNDTLFACWRHCAGAAHGGGAGGKATLAARCTVLSCPVCPVPRHVSCLLRFIRIPIRNILEFIRNSTNASGPRRRSRRESNARGPMYRFVLSRLSCAPSRLLSSSFHETRGRGRRKWVPAPVNVCRAVQADWEAQFVQAASSIRVRRLECWYKTRHCSLKRVDRRALPDQA